MMHSEPPPSAMHEGSPHWKRTLTVVWLSQFLSIMGFNFALPFAPYFIQEDLGITDPAQLKLWIAAFFSVTHVALATFGPVWGTLADRYGRRLMLLRANLAGAVVMALMGTVHSVQALVGLRFLQGVFTGTMTAAQTLVSVETPERRTGFALGMLSTAVFSGGMLGAFLGGVVAELYGYRVAFCCSSATLLLAAILVVFGVREPAGAPAAREGEDEGVLSPAPKPALGAALPVLCIVTAIAAIRQFEAPMLPLLVQEMNGGIAGASARTGVLSAIGALAGLLAGVVFGRAADTARPATVASFAALGAALMVIPQGLAHSFPLLYAARFLMIFCAGGLEPAFQVWIIRATPQSQRGAVFGWLCTFRSGGWVVAPVVSGLVAVAGSIRSVFFVTSGLYLLLIPFIAFVTRRAGRGGAAAA